ncbi:type II secretion system F family protein [Bounagaea algeriensis]
MTAACALAAVALLGWPGASTRSRVAALRRRRSAGGTARRWPGDPVVRRFLRSPRRGGAAVLATALVLGGTWAAGTGGAVAALVAAGAGGHCYRVWERQRRRGHGWEDLAAGLRLFVAQLRAGAHPAGAAEGVAAESPGRTGALFREIAMTARLGGDVSTVLAAAHRTGPRSSMARAWRLAERHGAGLAELLDAVRCDLENRAAFQHRVQADMAGPRATALVLAVLPVFGLALGEASGAGPLAVLRGTLWGQVLLVVGVALAGCGAVWTLRLTEAGAS